MFDINVLSVFANFDGRGGGWQHKHDNLYNRLDNLYNSMITCTIDTSTFGSIYIYIYTALMVMGKIQHTKYTWWHGNVWGYKTCYKTCYKTFYSMGWKLFSIPIPNAFASDLSGLYLCRRFEIVDSFLVELAFNVPNSKPWNDVQVYRVVSVAGPRNNWICKKAKHARDDWLSRLVGDERFTGYVCR